MNAGHILDALEMIDDQYILCLLYTSSVPAKAQQIRG